MEDEQHDDTWFYLTLLHAYRENVSKLTENYSEAANVLNEF